MTTPFIGCLTGSDAAELLGGTYCYRGRGVTTPLHPDLMPDQGGTDGGIAFDQGDLWRSGREVGWRGSTLLDFGVDIQVDFAQEVFVDRLVLRQSPSRGSALAGIELLVPEGAGLSVCGRTVAATDGVLEGERIAVVAAVRTSFLVIRLHACYRDIVIEEAALFGAVLGGPVVYPVPASYETRPGEPLELDAVAAVRVAESAGPDCMFAAQLLAEKIAEEFRRTIPVIRGNERVEPVICIGSPSEVPLDGIPDEMTDEEYVLGVAADGATIVASGRRGLVYGVETFLALLRRAGDEPAVAACRIADRPKMALRGVHFGLPPREEIPFFKRLVRYVLAPMRYNTVFLEFAGGMQFERRPEINETWLEANRKGQSGQRPPIAHGKMVAGGQCLTKDEVRGVVASIREYGLDVIPEVQSLSHVQYLTATYPHIAEIEDRPADEEQIDLEKADEKPADFYPHCYCPSKEESYAIVFDLIDEITEVVQPRRYVHMGHDEVYLIGVCAECRGKDPADLYARHVDRVHAYLKSKGYDMMIWSDMLQPCTRYQTAPAIAKIPRDIVMLDFIWYFHFDKDLEDNLLKAGFQVGMGNMYSSHYPRFESRSVKPGMVGAEVSTWLRTDEYTLGSEGKIYDFLYSANMMWWPGYRRELRRVFDEIITDMLPRLRERLHGATYPSLAPAPTCVPFEFDDGAAAGEDRLGSLALPRGDCQYRGVPFRITSPAIVQGRQATERRHPRSISVPACGTFDSIVFLHGCSGNAVRTPWQPLTRIAEYHVIYKDGATEIVPVEYGGNIAPIHRRHAEPMTSPIYRHQGYIGTYFADPFVKAKTCTGKDVTLYGYEWLNPHPDREIVSVGLVATEGAGDCSVMLFAATGIVTEHRFA